jgi:CheY-like chemotaxis protein
MGSTRDISKEKRITEELLKAQKLESLGVLAGGIAHDFNNILTAILTNISMARMYGDLHEEVSKMLADAEVASLRARDLTQQLLTFAKGGTPIKKPTSISGSLKGTTEFALSGSNLRCEYSIPEDLWLVDIDKGQISQVIQNLVTNAKQAMPEGGVIKVCAENVALSKKDAIPLKRGKYVKVSLTDQGTGIPEKHLQKIFDPFFTTKQEGRGLGLAISFSIMKNHGGWIQVDSQMGVGTTFSVYLPTSGKTTKPKEREKGESLRGEGRILLIDDEELVRRSAGNVLRHLGYDVEVARDGKEGITLYDKAMKIGKSFDVVIMDLTIPGGMGGKRAIQELMRIDPKAKVIVSSGYSNDPVMSSFREYGYRGVVSKPYRIEELAEVIRTVMTESS